MSPTTTLGTQSGTATAEPVAAGSPSRHEEASAPGTATTAGKVGSLLVKKLAEVMLEAERVPKRGRNDFHKYDYATESDITGAIRKGLASRGLMILPRVTGRTFVDKTNESGKATSLAYVDVTFAVMDAESGDCLEFPWLGCGEDKGDKAIYKAFTGALKYFLLKLFLIPTGDDPEREDAGKGKAKPDRSQRPDVPVPTTGDAAAILNVAAQLEKITGHSMSSIILAASRFKPKVKDSAGKEVDGPERSFTDPTRVTSEKWLKKVRLSLEKDLQGLNATAEPVPF